MKVDPASLLPCILRLHERIREAVLNACEREAEENLSEIDRDGSGDTVYAIDAVSEEALVEFLEEEAAARFPLALVAEGLTEGPMILPRGASEEDARWRIIVDPIDGTRGLMYQKRSAWILTGAAPNRGPETNLKDIVLAVQTEIPLIKQHLCDVLWCEAGGPVQAIRHNRLTGVSAPLSIRPSRATSIEHGFATVSRFFPGLREILAVIDEEIALGALGPVRAGKAHCFEDQYISTGGQLYELMIGHDRFIADLRPLMEEMLRERGMSLGICCHPYDLCTELIARQAGVIVVDPAGRRIDAPLSVEPELSWAGYCNQAIREQVEPLLQQALARHAGWRASDNSAAGEA